MTPSQSFGGFAALAIGAGLLASVRVGGGALIGVGFAVYLVLLFCNRLDARDRRDAKGQTRKPEQRKHPRTSRR